MRFNRGRLLISSLFAVVFSAVFGTTAWATCPGDGDCFLHWGNGTPGCDDAICCDTVCAESASCCDTEWDEECAALAGAVCNPPQPTTWVVSPGESIQAAIDAASNGDEIVVEPGTYRELLLIDDKNLTIRSVDPMDIGIRNATIISGDLDPPDGIGDGRVIECRHLQHVLIDGLTIRDGTQSGLRTWNAGATIQRCLFTANRGTASQAGAVTVLTEFGPVTIKSCEFVDNGHLDDGYSIAGGIRASNAPVVIVNCLFRENAGLNGGAISGTASTLLIASCLFVGNQASGDGGAVQTYNSKDQIVNCTFVNNAADTGPGAGEGGAIFATQQVNGYYPTEVVNCVVWSNSPDEISTDVPESLEVRSCIVQGGYVGVNNVDIDPKFVDEDGADDDPATLVDNDYALSAGSPAIDSGDGAAWIGTIADGRGKLRLADDPVTVDTGIGPPPVIDIGAYEFQRCLGDITLDNTVDVQDLTALILQFGGEGDGDLNGDGVVDVSDLTLLILAWGDCPQPAGACCVPGVQCQMVTETQCYSFNGTFFGESISCEWVAQSYDADADGLSDMEEQCIGTDPNSADSDNDSLPDGWEVAAGFDPLNADSDFDGISDGNEDDDDDGLTNEEEWVHGTVHFVADSDGDGVNDGDEVSQGSDPNDHTDDGPLPEGGSNTWVGFDIDTWIPDGAVIIVDHHICRHDSNECHKMLPCGTHEIRVVPFTDGGAMLYGAYVTLPPDSCAWIEDPHGLLGLLTDFPPNIADKVAYLHIPCDNDGDGDPCDECPLVASDGLACVGDTVSFDIDPECADASVSASGSAGYVVTGDSILFTSEGSLTVTIQSAICDCQTVLEYDVAPERPVIEFLNPLDEWFESYDEDGETQIRIFPGRRSYDAPWSPADNLLQFRATTAALSESPTIFFRVYDVDDPTSMVTPVDPNDGNGPAWR